MPSRGDVVAVVLPGAYGKPRPALIVQSDLFAETPSVTLCPLTSTLRAAPLLRISVAPTATNGLREPSQIMIDKLVTVPREKIGGTIGRLEDTIMVQVGRAITVFLGLV